MAVSKSSIEFAICNIAEWGDTDVLPFPVENHWFHDEKNKVVGLLQKLDKNFDKWFSSYPIKYERCLSCVGHIGYRGVTQIDPIWNAYLLALVIEVGSDIEAARLPAKDNQVFSYRFSPDPENHSIFDKEVSWRQFQEQALKLSQSHKYLLSADISDFYPRVYHHRLENALRHATNNKNDICTRILKILSKISIGRVSYGLPVGGGAARLLCEIVLNRTDRLLKSNGIKFCRFVDDYFLFANSEEDARKSLVYLSDILLRHEGLSLNRGKSRLMTQDEFFKMSVVAESAALESESHRQTQKFFKIRLKYDPYSPTAEGDYEKLRKELEQFDILGMLARELKKARIDEALTKQIVKSLKYLDQETKAAAVESLVKSLDLLYPIFPTVTLVVRALIPELTENISELVFKRVHKLVHEKSHILQVPANLAFAQRLLAEDPSEAADTAIAKIYKESESWLVKRDSILCMARRNTEHLLGDIIRQPAATTDLWLRRALIPGSFVLGEEGHRWRHGIKNELHEVDMAFMNWVESKIKLGSWKAPI